MVFGTAKEGGFYEKLKELIGLLKEGELKPKNAKLTYVPQDDKLDFVAWIPFNDEHPSKLICFGQCKTGTHWKQHITDLQSSSFLKKWFSSHPIVNPVETFMIADVVNPSDFYHRTVDNLFLDRIRIASLSYLKPDNTWFESLKKWTTGLMKQQNFYIPN